MKTLLSIIFFLLVSCTNQVTVEEKSKKNEILEVVNEKTSFEEIFLKISSKNLPNINTSSFDNFTKIKAFNKKELKVLQIEKIYSEHVDMKTYPSYKLNISEKYKTIVITTFKGEHEMESALVNYTLKGEYIESLIISYDEIAESMFRKESKIEGQSITVFDIVSGNEKQITEKKYHISPYNGAISIVEFNVKSDLRPTEKIALNKIYIDTVKFLSYNNEGDYFLLISEKNDNKFYFTYNWEQNKKYNFKYGDMIIVEWKMVSLFEAGKDDFLFFKEGAINASKLDVSVIKNDTIKFLWRELEYDKELEAKVNSIFVNHNYCNNISEQEKAAIGFVATFIGNECWWEFGDVNEDRSNLQCKILTALNLGFQCSEKHLGFLKKWFATDNESLNKLSVCGTTPYTATVQNTFDEIKILNDGKTITLLYKVNAVNFRKGKSWSWSQIDYFEYNNKNIKFLKTEKSEVLEEEMTIGEN